MRSRELGLWGETLAAEYLKKKRYQIIERNYTSRFGEIDLIAKTGGVLVFVEVKLRKDSRFAEAKEFVDFRKQKNLITTAMRYLQWHESDLQPRFDVIEIYAPEGQKTKNPIINHLEDAFS